MSKRNKKNKVPTAPTVPTIGQIVKCYNKLTIASITWSRKEERLKLYQNILTPVTADWINEIFITGKQVGDGQYLEGTLTVKTLKEMKDIMLEFDDFFKNSDENLDEESRKYFDLPLDDDDPINEDVMKDFLEEWDDGEIIDV